ncbi:Abi family protein [Paenibacillus sp. LHD-38]|uniref:Abi family protein n=1 Tax=Paenibacillus sp. LHD-38 TaxID=3072143 RepID=UPI00280DBD86|nr:Abi family protein [Paenibacillus sp. LHD-38]MDQ8735103.1 Abi family protein [Paenibacillus sp. LHD-38]
MNVHTTIQLKPPTTFEEQLDILTGRGLIVQDRQLAINVLSRSNYYRFTAYALTFKNKSDRFHKGTTFETLYMHYMFDRKLRILLLEIIEPIEIAFRTHLSYLIAHHYGAEGHLDPQNFKDADKHQSFLLDLQRCLGQSTKDLYVQHHNSRYGGRFPVWVALETVTLGTLSKLFSNLKVADSKHIAQEYYPSSHYKEISSWLHSLTLLRNRCAHYSRIFNRSFPSQVRIPKQYKSAMLQPSSLFATIIGIKFFSTPETWEMWLVKLLALMNEYPGVRLDRIGFTPDWYDLLSQ